MSLILEAKNIFKSYKTVDVLKDISLSIENGEIVSLLGSSGAGKTTLLNILGTLDFPDKGEVKIMGESVFKYNDSTLSKFRNKNIGFIFQFHNLLPEFNAFENIILASIIYQKHTSEIDKKAKELMKYLKIDHRANNKPNQLSGGEQQRVAIARALINNPAIVFADEPTGNLDSKNAENFHELILELKNNFNQTFLIATHNEKLASIGNRKLRIIDGGIYNE